MSTNIKHYRLTTFILFILALVFPLSLKLTWWHLDNGTTSWDDSCFLDHSFKLFDALCQGGLRGFYSQFLKTLPVNGPFVAVQAIPFYLVLGRSIRAALLINIFYFSIFSFYLFALCRKYWNATVGLLAIFITSMCPLLYGLFNTYMRDYSYAAFVTALVYYILNSNRLKSRINVFILGLVMGLGILHRMILPIYVFPMILFFVLLRLKEIFSKTPKASGYMRLILDLCLLLFSMLVFTAHWYWHNWQNIFSFSWRAAYGDLATHYGDSQIFSPRVIGLYLYECARMGVSYWNLVLLAIGIAGSLYQIMRRKITFRELFPDYTALILLLWLSPFFLFLFSQNKDIRFIAPLLPAFGTITALFLWTGLRALKGSEYLTIILVSPQCIISIFSLFYLTPHNQTLAKFVKSIKTGGYATYPERDYWPYQDTLNLINNHAQMNFCTPATVIILNDSAFFNGNVLQLHADINHIPFVIYPISWMTDEKMAQNAIEKSDYIICQRNMTRTSSPYSGKAGINVLGRMDANGSLQKLYSPIVSPEGCQIGIWYNPNKNNVLSAETLIKKASYVTVRWPFKATWKRINAMGNNLIMSAWAPHENDPTCLRLPLTTGKYVMMASCIFSEKARCQTELELSLVSAQDKKTIFKETFDPGRKKDCNINFMVDNYPAEFEISLKMAKPKQSADDATMIMENIKLEKAVIK